MFLCVEIDAHLYTARIHMMLQLLWYLHCAVFFYVKKACFNKSDKYHPLSTFVSSLQLCFAATGVSLWLNDSSAHRKTKEEDFLCALKWLLVLWAEQSTVRQRSLLLRKHAFMLCGL